MTNPLFLLSFLYYPDDLVHVLIVVLSIVVLGISLLAFMQKRNKKYLLLTLAFFFLAISQVLTLFETLFLSGALIMIPIVDIHITHLFDFLMLLTFGMALVRNWDQGEMKVLHIEE